MGADPSAPVFIGVIFFCSLPRADRAGSSIFVLQFSSSWRHLLKVHNPSQIRDRFTALTVRKKLRTRLLAATALR